MHKRTVSHIRKTHLVLPVVALLLVMCAGIFYVYVAPSFLHAGGSQGGARTEHVTAVYSNEPQDHPAPMARWPWPQSKTDHPHKGVKHWIDRSSPDGTVLELIDFDFRANPSLRLELYDQDEDDKIPFDNQSKIWIQAVGQAAHHLNEAGRGRVIAAWNGLFFQGENGRTSHVAPVVLDGRALYNVGLVRWAVGVKYHGDHPAFKVMRLPPFRVLAHEYDFAAEGASCLILDAKPLHLQPFPKPDEYAFPPSEVPGPGDAGFVRKVDHIRTSRTSLAWSKNNRHFYLLVVKEPDSESESLMALRFRRPSVGGWTVADEQRFWHQFGAWCAVNLDGGDVTQLALLRRDGRYDLVPARWGSSDMRLILPPDLAGAPYGGSMMYFFIRDTSSDTPH
jgi:hypothetical protein